MPRLSRLRFCNVGPERARMDDLILDFRDAEKWAIDSTIWLRNGGGKTSILSLFFALLRPDKRDVFGSKAEPDDKKLDDYVQLDAPGLVVAEWQLDSDPRVKASDKPEHYLTGVFYEKHSGSSSDRLRRLFFAARVIPKEPCLTLDGLPIYTEGSGVRKRRMMNNFKQEWQAIGLRYPHAEVQETEHQGEWKKILDAAGIDSEIFGYQIQMNRDEGGAAKLFKFKETEEFIDFFLELIVDFRLGISVAKNIEIFRSELRQRLEELLPEQELFGGVLERLEPLVGLADKREEMYRHVAYTKAELDLLSNHLNDHSAALHQEIMLAAQRENEARHEASRLQKDAALCRQRANFFRYLAAQEKVKQLTADCEELSERAETAQREERIWQAAIPFRELIRATKEVADLQAQLKQSQVEHAPLLRQVETAARKYAAALHAKIQRLQEEEKIWTQTEQEARQKARTAHNQAAVQRQEAAVLEERAKNVADQIHALHQVHARLEELGTLHSGEDWRTACDRLTHQKILCDEEQRTLERTIVALEQEIIRTNEGATALIRTEAHAARLEAEVRNRLEAAQAERQVIEQDEQLQRYLELEVIDLERLDGSAIAQLRRAERAIEQRVLSLWALLIDRERTICHLEENELLPPSRDVESVLEVLDTGGVTAWSGWEYMSKNVSAANARDFIQQAPELVLGVIVRNTHFQKAQNILQAANLKLDVPVVIAPQNAIEREDKRTTFVIGPTSDAYFDRNTGQTELSERQAQQVQEQHTLEANRRELAELRVSISRFEKFRQQYPSDWIREQQEELNQAIEQQQTCQTDLSELTQVQQQICNEIACKRQRQNSLTEERSAIREHLTRLEEYGNHFATDPSILGQQYSDLKIEAKSKQNVADQLTSDGEYWEQRAKTALTETRKLTEEVRIVKDEISKIEYCKGRSPSPKAGDIESLRRSYHQLVNFYEQRIGGNALSALLERAKRVESEARQKFTTALHEDISEKVVGTGLNSLADPGEAEQRHRNAMQAYIEVRKAHEDKGIELKQAKQELINLEQECMRLGLTETFRAEVQRDGERNFDLSADEEQSRAQDLEAIADDRNAEAQTAAAQSSEHNNLIQILSKDRKRIETIISSFAELLQAVTQEVAQAKVWTAPLDNEVDSRLDNLEQQLKLAQQERSRLDSISHAAKQAIQRCIDEVEYKHGKIKIAHQLRMWFEDDYENQCDELQNQLNLRLQHIKDSLAEVDTHWNQIIEQILEAAERGVRILKSVETRSKLPPSLRELGERSFLKITLHLPTDPTEMRTRIEELLDDIVKSGTVPTGIELVQQAVRRLARPIQIRMLFPDPDSAPQYDPITAMTRRSGGEQLTSAILLYCTLAQLRARERGRQMDGSSTLFLDNPIGKASRSKFLELQREVARAMNIQLIYTTGVNDFEAIRMFPNIIRLRNDRGDRSTGERLLEIEPNDGYLQEARLMLTDNQSLVDSVE